MLLTIPLKVLSHSRSSRTMFRSWDRTETRYDKKAALDAGWTIYPMPIPSLEQIREFITWWPACCRERRFWCAAKAARAARMHGGCVLAYEGSDSKRGDRPYESGMFR